MAYARKCEMPGFEAKKRLFQYLSAGDRIGEHFAAGVFDGAAGGKPSCQAGNFNAGIF